MMLPGLPPETRALVYGLAGGMPLYLGWWQQGRTVTENLLYLVGNSGGPLLTEGRLITRLVPAGDDPRRSRRAIYRIADNFLAFYLGPVLKHRTEIERGHGRIAVPAIERELDSHLGLPYEEAFRECLWRKAEDGTLGAGEHRRDRPVVEVGCGPGSPRKRPRSPRRRPAALHHVRPVGGRDARRLRHHHDHGARHLPRPNLTTPADFRWSAVQDTQRRGQPLPN
jgi:hypothetical protein